MKALFTLLFLAVISSSYAQKVRIAAAADLRYAMDEVVAAYKTGNPQAILEVIYGSSGNAFTQISNGAPYDLFFSADVIYPQKLHEEGFTIHEPVLYAIGRIVLWSASVDVSKGVSVLSEYPKARIAIANPSHAPYGLRAEETLRHYGVFDGVKPRLIYGENISQAAQFCLTGNAQFGIIALSLALSPNMQSKGSYFLIDDATHKPLQQSFVILNRAKDNSLALAFAEFVSSPQAIKIFKKYGFVCN